MMIYVETYDPTGKRVGRKEIDFTNGGNRKWLNKHQHWALNNNHHICTGPVEIKND